MCSRRVNRSCLLQVTRHVTQNTTFEIRTHLIGQSLTLITPLPYNTIFPINFPNDLNM